MSNTVRYASAAVGSLCAIPSLGVLLFTFAFALYPMSHEPLAARATQIAKEVFTDPPFTVITLTSVLLVYAGIFLCVKAILDPPRFEAHTARHLLLASGIASALTFVPLALVLFVFSG